MKTLETLIVLEVVLVAYIASRVLRYQVAPNPTLRAATLTACALLLAMISVTEPIEVLLRGPDGLFVWGPTLLKHLAVLGCGAGVLLMTLAQRQVRWSSPEMWVWAWFLTSSVTVTGLHVFAGGGGARTSVDYVEWSHHQPLLVTAMLVTYVGGLAASLGVFAVIWPINIRSSAGRGLAIMAAGAALTVVWCFFRVRYLVSAALLSSQPQETDFYVTQLLSVFGLMLLTLGLVWSTAEADVVAWRHWRRFRVLNHRILEVVPEVRRGSDRRLGLDAWFSDRAVEVLDGLYVIEQQYGSRTGFPRAPRQVSDGELTGLVAGLGNEYRDRRVT